MTKKTDKASLQLNFVSLSALKHPKAKGYFFEKEEKQMPEKIITLADGSGGVQTSKLIDTVFAMYLNNEYLSQMDDATVIEANSKIAITTDSFVVDPMFFKGSNIGRLSVCGTVNDLLMRGAVPKYLTCGFILQTGLKISDLEKIVKSMAETAKEAGVKIIAGDTKVVEGKGECFINTTGVGFIENDLNIGAKSAKSGDIIILTGTLGDHHAAILSQRLSIENDIKSDAAPLNNIVLNLLNGGIHISTMRDVTRGGLATVLNEIAKSSKHDIIIYEDKIPVSLSVKDFCSILGLESYYMGNEGKAVIILPENEAQKALEIIKSSDYGENAAVIGIVSGNGERLILNTKIGGKRLLGPLIGEGLPRIC